MKLLFGAALATLKWACIACSVLVMLVGTSVAQQAQPASVGPVPIQIAAARKVFISNMGVDSRSYEAFRASGDVSRPYEQFYAAMKKWGHYDLVSSPSEAELVFEIRFEAPLVGANGMDVFDPHFELRIVDARTHFVLWSVLEPVGGAFRRATWLKNFDTGLGNVMKDIKDLTVNTP
ncbi:MAG TPA: hypothetical protein VFU86_00595 [Terriglobales bacterium]|nr:hypothetical protein [Terriglobales bacterium]